MLRVLYRPEHGRGLTASPEGQAVLTSISMWDVQIACVCSLTPAFCSSQLSSLKSC